MYGEWLQEFDEYGEPVHNPDGSELRTLHPTENNIIQGNYIGPDISGLKPLGNSNGIRYGDYAFRNIIGGTEPGAVAAPGVGSAMRTTILNGPHGGPY